MITHSDSSRLWRRAATALFVIVSAACGGNARAVTGPEIRIGYGGPKDFGDVGAELAHARLEAQGYRVRVTTFASTEIAVDALARGEVDMGSGSTRSYWAAAAKGAPIRAIVDHAANVFQLVVAGTRTDCDALDGKRVALHAEGAVGTVLARAYFADRCPSIKPEVLLVPVSANRLSALLSGSVDAAVLKLSDVSLIDRQAPGRFTVMADFGQTMPDLKTMLLQVNQEFARAHPDWVYEYVKARVLANRDIAGRNSTLLQHAQRVLGTDTDWTPEARAYTSLRIWHPDGGVTRQQAERTLRFLIDRGGLDPALTVDRVADLSFLERVLDEVKTTGPAGTVTD